MSSTAVSMLTAWVTLPTGELLRVSDVQLGLDEGWAPFASATITIPYTAARFAGLDPRDHVRVRGVLRRQWYDTALLEDMTAAWAGSSLAALSAEFGGSSLAQIGAALSTEWEAGTQPADEVRFDLAVRSRRRDYAADTIVIGATSDEQPAQGSRVLLSSVVAPYSAYVSQLLEAAGLPSVVDMAGYPVASQVIPSTLVVPDRSVFDLASAPAQAAGLRLYADQMGVWRLVDPLADPVGDPLHLSRVESGTDDTGVDDEFADVIVHKVTGWVYTTWNPGTGVGTAPYQTTLWEVWPDPVPAGPHTAVLVETDAANQANPATEPAQLSTLYGWVAQTDYVAARLDRTVSRGRTQTLTVVADLRARPGMAVSTGAPSLPETTGRLAAVAWRLPADTMTVTIRSVED